MRLVTHATGKPSVEELESRLALSAPGSLEDDELQGLPDPVRRYLLAAIAPGTPLARSARLSMRGSIRLGSRWLPFRAREVLAPHHGYVWAARVAGLMSGSDQCADGRGWMTWRLFGRIPMVRAEGPDVFRSAAGRGGGEAVWVPTKLLPRFGVEWTAEDDTHVTARFGHDGVDLTLRLELDARARIESVRFDRWGDPDNTGTFALHPFGIEVIGSATFGDVTIPYRGRAGWFHGTERWVEGEFFRYEITALGLVAG